MDIANFVGVETVIHGKVLTETEGVLRIQSDGVVLEASGDLEPGEDVYVCLRPEDVTIWKSPQSQQSSARNRITGVIHSITPAGVLERVVMDCGFPVVSLVTRLSRIEMELTPGDVVQVGFKASAAHLIKKNRQ
jgi:molybdopterin-binding protein